MAKKKQPVKVEPVIEEPEEAAEDEEEVTCPVCGEAVGLDVLTCPSCGAEFEAEEVEEVVEDEPAAVPPRAEPVVEQEVEEEAVGEDEMAECPVCGNSVSLNVPACPYCGAEFEEEEVEEVIEVEEEPTPVPAARARPVPVEEEVAEVEVEEAVEATGSEYPEIQRTPIEPPSSITDLRVIGVSLVVLGIIGSQISFFIDWYWTWVPPIEDNLGMFLGIAALVVVAGILVFMMYKRSAKAKRSKKVNMVPGAALSAFLFGIFAVVMVLMWDPINSALQSSSVGVALAFIAIIIVGVLAVFMGQKMKARASAE